MITLEWYFHLDKCQDEPMKVKALSLLCRKRNKSFELVEYLDNSEKDISINSEFSHMYQINYFREFKSIENYYPHWIQVGLKTEEINKLMDDWLYITGMEARSFYFLLRTILYERYYPVLRSLESESM